MLILIDQVETVKGIASVSVNDFISGVNLCVLCMLYCCLLYIFYSCIQIFYANFYIQISHPLLVEVLVHHIGIFCLDGSHWILETVCFPCWVTLVDFTPVSLIKNWGIVILFWCC